MVEFHRLIVVRNVAVPVFPVVVTSTEVAMGRVDKEPIVVADGVTVFSGIVDVSGADVFYFALEQRKEIV